MLLRRLLRIPIALAVVWHAFAVAVYSLPSSAHDHITLSIKQRFNRTVTPYLLWTSQWQQWNLFSPDPLRRAEEYRIEALVGDTWVTVKPLAPHDIRWWRRADELKILRALADTQSSKAALRSRYVQAYCAPLALAAGTPVRLSYRYAVIPYANNARESMDLPSGTEWSVVDQSETACPPDDHSIASILLP